MRRLVLAIALVVIVVLVAGAGVVAAQRNGDVGVVKPQSIKRDPRRGFSFARSHSCGIAAVGIHNNDAPVFVKRYLVTVRGPIGIIYVVRTCI